MENFILPLVVGVIVVLVGLIFEYRTKWFVNHNKNNVSIQDDISMSDEDGINLDILEKTITPVDSYENPVGDWIKVAQELKKLLEESLSSELLGSLRLMEIKHKGDLTTLVFDFWTDNNDYWEISIVVTRDGRIKSYKRSLL